MEPELFSDGVEEDVATELATFVAARRFVLASLRRFLEISSLQGPHTSLTGITP